KQSTSDLLVANCDEFIFYDDLVRTAPSKSPRTRRHEAPAEETPETAPDNDSAVRATEDTATLKDVAVAMAVDTFDALLSERGESGKIWASTLQQAIKRRKPDFSESYYGFKAFGNLLEEAQARGQLTLGRDEKSGTYVFRPEPVEPAAKPRRRRRNMRTPRR